MIENIGDLIKGQGISVVCLTDTMLNTHSRRLGIEGFNELTAVRSPGLKAGGGVTCFVRDKIPFQRMKLNGLLASEFLWIKIHLSPNPINMVIVYFAAGSKPTCKKWNATLWEGLAGIYEKIKAFKEGLIWGF